MTSIAEGKEIERERVGDGVCVASTLLLICIIRTNACKMHLYLFLHLHLHIYLNLCLYFVCAFVCSFAFVFVFVLHFTPFVFVACDCIVGSYASSLLLPRLLCLFLVRNSGYKPYLISLPSPPPTLPLSFSFSCSCLSSLSCRNSCA